VPRYKEGELSGEEVLISAKVELLRNGRVIVERTFRDVATACVYLGAVHGEACDDGKGYFGGEGDICDQEGCAASATVTFRKKQDFCRAGHASEPIHITIRRFCERHRTRGNAGLDDADANYEVVP
jgi:hypothetical protein